MNLDKYLLFLRAAELGSISKAAAQMGYTQSGASHIIASLETELNIRLFQRERQGVSLTTEGRLLAPAIAEVISRNDQVHTIASSLSGAGGGTLRIAAFKSICLSWLPQIAGRFHQRFPGVKMEVLSADGSYEAMEELLIDGKADVSFVRFPLHHDLNGIPLFRDQLRLVVAQNHALASERNPLSLAQLAGQPFLMPSYGNNYDVLELFEKAQVTPNVVMTMHDDLALLAFAENGLGVTILPELILRSRPHRAAALKLEGEPTRTIGIALRSKQAAQPMVEAFVSMVRDAADEAAYLRRQSGGSELEGCGD